MYLPAPVSVEDLLIEKQLIDLAQNSPFEMWTWSQLGIHHKPIGLLNVDGFYDGLQSFLDHLVAEAFVKPVHRNILLSDDEPGRLIDRLLAAEIPTEGKWLEP